MPLPAAAACQTTAAAHTQTRSLYNTNTQAPVIVSPLAQDVNPYHLLARHLRPDVVSGPERFWKLLRPDLLTEKWRPRVQVCACVVCAAGHLDCDQTCLLISGTHLCFVM